MLIYRRVERLAEEGDRILDLGTKDGRYLNNIRGDVVAIDIQFAHPLQTNSPEYVTADGRKLPFEDNIFDYIILNQVLEHINGRRPLLQEINRVLKPDGVAVFSFPNRFAPSKPHSLPRYFSALPKSIGLRMSKMTLHEKEQAYYQNGLFPLSPLGARKLLSDFFDNIEYITIEESSLNPDIYSQTFAPQLFVTFLPLLVFSTKFPPVQLLFEGIWTHCAYECTHQQLISDTN